MADGKKRTARVVVTAQVPVELWPHMGEDPREAMTEAAKDAIRALVEEAAAKRVQKMKEEAEAAARRAEEETQIGADLFGENIQRADTTVPTDPSEIG